MFGTFISSRKIFTSPPSVAARLVEELQVYFVKTPVAGSTSFLTRPLTLVRSHLDKKCIVFRVDHDWTVTGMALSMVREIIFKKVEKLVVRLF